MGEAKCYTAWKAAGEIRASRAEWPLSAEEFESCKMTAQCERGRGTRYRHACRCDVDVDTCLAAGYASVARCQGSVAVRSTQLERVQRLILSRPGGDSLGYILSSQAVRRTQIRQSVCSVRVEARSIRTVNGETRIPLVKVYGGRDVARQMYVAEGQRSHVCRF